MRNIVFVFFAFLTICLCNCQGESKSKTHSIDLLEYGIPLSIDSPIDSPEIKTEDWIIKQGLTLKANNDYDLQLFYQDASSSDLPSLKARELTEVKSNRYFSAIMEENETGFIYETKVDSANINYGFRHIHLQGGKEFVFQQSLIGTFELDKVKTMYAAAQNVK